MLANRMRRAALASGEWFESSTGQPQIFIDFTDSLPASLRYAVRAYARLYGTLTGWPHDQVERFSCPRWKARRSQRMADAHRSGVQEQAAVSRFFSRAHQSPKIATTAPVRVG